MTISKEQLVKSLSFGYTFTYDDKSHVLSNKNESIILQKAQFKRIRHTTIVSERLKQNCLRIYNYDNLNSILVS